MALGKGRLSGPGCDRPPRLDHLLQSESHLGTPSSTHPSMTTANTWPGTQTTTRQLRQHPEPESTDPRSPMGPKLPTVTEALGRCGRQPMVIIRSVAPDGHAPRAMFWDDDNNVAVEADVVPSNTTESCACLCSRIPLSPSTRWRDEAMSRHWWGCGCVDCGDGIHRRIAGSPRLNLPSTSSLGAASGFADPKPSP